MNTVDRVFTTIAQIWGVIFTLLLILVIVVYVKYGDEYAPAIKLLFSTLSSGYKIWREREREHQEWEAKYGSQDC